MSLSRYDFDLKMAGDPSLALAGVDEAGRGPLAGPVVAAAVIFKPGAPLLEVNDSKCLAPSRREELFHQILQYSDWGLGVCDESKIDQINIYHATKYAMRQAVLALPRKPDLVIIDGNMKIDIPYRQETVVKGDLKSAAIGAASIIAKVYRDRWMEGLDEILPGYGFARHKGYATPEHLAALQKLGPSFYHRKTFAPVHELLQKAFL